MKRIPKTPQRAKFNAQKRGSRVQVQLRCGSKDPKVDDLRFKSSVFWPFPKPKNLEQWWWAITIGVILVTYAYIVLFSIILAP